MNESLPAANTNDTAIASMAAAEQQRIAAVLESHPLLRDKAVELRAAADSKRDARVEQLRQEVANVEHEMDGNSKLQGELKREIEALVAKHQEGLFTLNCRLADMTTNRANLSERRRKATHEIQRLQCDRPAGAPFEWSKTAPSWFEHQLQKQKNVLPSATFAPPMREVITYHGNQLVIERVPL